MSISIDLVATGANIRRLRIERGISVTAIQEHLGLSTPRVIYKWQRGECLPSTDNLIALSNLFGVCVNDIVKTRQTDE